MAEQYKIIHPIKYYRDYLNHDIRPDGREFNKFRPIAVNVGSIKTCDGSSVVKIGNTTVVCGIRAELSKPKSNDPNSGYLMPSIELIPTCSNKYRTTIAGGGSTVSSNSVTGGSIGGGGGSIGQSSTNEENELYTCALNDILLSSNCVNLNDLCIAKEKLVWTLYCDISCIDHDGCIIDASLIAIIAALRNLTLPKIIYDSEINKITVDNKIRSKLNIQTNPISTTLMLFDDNVLITDPTREEEDLSSSIITIAVCNSQVSFILKPGGTPFDQDQMDMCIEQALLREKSVLELLDNALKS